MTSPSQLLQDSLASWGLEIPAETQAKLLEFLDYLLQANQKLNLTSIEYPQAVSKHLVDSLAALLIPGIHDIPGPWLDLGSGGGLPGIPLALALPDKEFVLIESTQKKAKFLEASIEKFGLGKRVKVETRRAEDLGQGPARERAGLVVCRAVGKLPIILELSLPLLMPQGKMVAYKGPQAAEEVQNSIKALKVLGGELENVVELTLPFSGEARRLVCVKKVGITPKTYPRLPGVPAKSPLV